MNQLNRNVAIAQISSVSNFIIYILQRSIDFQKVA